MNVATKNNIPVFCSDVDTINLGVLAAVGPNQYKLGENAGSMVVDILKDHEFPQVQYAEDTEYVVNKDSAVQALEESQ